MELTCMKRSGVSQEGPAQSEKPAQKPSVCRGGAGRVAGVLAPSSRSGSWEFASKQPGIAGDAPSRRSAPGQSMDFVDSGV